MKTLSISDLVRMECETGGICRIEETVWGLKNGVYRALGELQLPVCGWVSDQTEQGGMFVLMTQFRDSFFAGIKPDLTHVDPYEVPDSIYGVYDNSAKQCVGVFLEEFFKTYQTRSNEKDREVRDCITRSFIPYDSIVPEAT